MSSLRKSIENNVLYQIDLFQFKIQSEKFPENRLQNSLTKSTGFKLDFM